MVAVDFFFLSSFVNQFNKLGVRKYVKQSLDMYRILQYNLLEFFNLENVYVI